MINRQKIYTAALLHDIGKFYQRADIFNKDKSSYFEMLDDDFRQLEATYCPVYNGKHSHKHVLWTAQFIEKVLGLHERQYDKTKTESLLDLAASHHNPSGFEHWLITLADHLSSSADRNQITQDVKHENDWGHYRQTPLLSVFEVVGREQNKSEWHYRLPVRLLDARYIMPETKENMPDMTGLYAETWKNFEKELHELIPDPKKILDDKNTIESLYFLLEKYLINIPSSTQDLPDISLFDHSKTTAAFALSLYDYVKEKGIAEVAQLKALRLDNQTQPFLLLGGDLSGIQSYLYKIKSKYAAKNLKGRSFMLHLIGTSIVQKILDLLDLYQSHIIYNSGGSFFMLLPNTEKTRNTIAKLHNELSLELLDKFGGDLYVALATTPFSMPDIFDKRLNLLWQEVHQKLAQDKTQRFKRQIAANYQNFFEPTGQPEQSVLDSITGDEIPEDQAVKIDDMILSPLSKQQIELGKQLKAAKYWYMVKDGWSKKDGGVTFLGYTHLLKPEHDTILDGLQEVIRYRFNETDFIQPAGKCLQAFEFYGGNDYPVDKEGNPVTFDQLCSGDYNKLGIVRMDVDNLGYIFKNGFTDTQKTFSRYAALSRNLDLFFRAYINTLWQQNPVYQKHVFILYSGGDDLFVLGDWKIVQDFAEELRTDFRHFVCYNPYLTLSGGNLIVPPKFPILKAAQKAGNVEKLAKNYVYKNKKLTYRLEDQDRHIVEVTTQKNKDAFAFLNVAMGWESEYPEVKKQALFFYEKVTSGALPKAFLQKLINYYVEADKLRTTWLMSYDFSRMKERYKNEKNTIENILKDILNNTWQGKPHEFAYNSFKLYALAARWAELRYRDAQKTLNQKTSEYELQ